MQNIAEFRIIGRVGKVDAKDKVTFLDVAANYNRKVDGEWTSDAHWNRITCFGKLAERASGLETGDLIHLQGRVRNSSYEKDGERIYTVDLIAERLGTIVKAGAPDSDEPEEAKK